MLSEIVGQDYAVRIVRNIILEQRASGSYLFLGPANVGKSTTAMEFAKALLCDNPQETIDSCGDCASCRMVVSDTHPDLRSVSPAGPSHVLRILQIWPRDGVKEFPAHSAMLRDLEYGPVRGKRRVFIVRESDALNEDTANSMLKVLEEPPPHATFILTALGQSSVLPTILSRCQAIRFQSVGANKIEELILQRGLAEPAKANYAASMSYGQVGVGLAIAGDYHSIAARDAVNEIASEISENNIPIKALKLAEDLRKTGAKLFNDKNESSDTGGARIAGAAALELLAIWYRDLIACQENAAKPSIFNKDQCDRLASIAAKYDSFKLMRGLEIVLAIKEAVEHNANIQLAFEAMTLRLAEINEA